METLFSYFTALSDAFVNPHKRIFVGYLASALMIAAAAYLLANKGNLRAGLAALRTGVLSPTIWWSASARADYKLLAVNQAIMLFAAPRLLTQLTVAVLLFEQFHAVFGAPLHATRWVPTWAVVALFTLVQFLADDLSRYLLHRVLHRSALLWPFHKVHHSAETLTPITVYRTHPVENVLFALRSVMVQGAVIASFVFCFGDRVELMAVLGVNVFMFVFNAASANLRHSHVSISYGAVVEHLLMSPAQHQLHHSAAPEHFDRNFGSVLSLWDWIGGTLRRAEPNVKLKFGVADGQAAPHSLRQLYLAPFGEVGAVVRRQFPTLAAAPRSRTVNSASSP